MSRSHLLVKRDSAQQLGHGALLNVKIDGLSVPHSTMMVATKKLAASGIPVHSHTWEDEMTYVINGRGFALINEEQTSVPIETGSVLYIPIGPGLKSADPKAPMDILLVTTPVKPNGLGTFSASRRWSRGTPAQSARRGVPQVGEEIRHGGPQTQVIVSLVSSLLNNLGLRAVIFSPTVGMNMRCSREGRLTFSGCYS
jgi:quercetin dioxygenase-like cupin family protein